MTELAFNLNGEPFDLPSQAAGWRVRRLKTKGAPEVVYGRDGVPLIIPIDSDINDLRDAARAEGRYRLDPVDDHSRPVPNSQASYVCVPPAEPPPESAVHAAPPPAYPDAAAQLIGALLESQKQHTELARMFVSQFPVLVNALSGVIRSAGDAGLPERTPIVVPVVTEAKPPDGSANAKADKNDPDDEDEDDNEEEDEEVLEEIELAAEPEHNWPRVVQSIVDHVMPQVTPLLASVPAMGAMFAAKRAKAIPGDVPGSGPQSPAPAEDAEDAAFDNSLLLRVNAILARLKPEEEAFARELVREIAPTDLPKWLGTLRKMSVDEGVAYVREQLAQAVAAAEASARPAARAERPVHRVESPGEPLMNTASSSIAEPPAARREGMRTTRAASNVPAAPSPAIAVTPPGSRLLSQEAQAHLIAIQRTLTIDENKIMRAWFHALSPDERTQWVQRQLALSVPDAVAMLRAEMIDARSGAPAPAAGPAEAADASIAPVNLAALVSVVAEPPVARAPDMPDSPIAAPAAVALDGSAAPSVNAPVTAAPTSGSVLSIAEAPRVDASHAGATPNTEAPIADAPNPAPSPAAPATAAPTSGSAPSIAEAPRADSSHAGADASVTSSTKAPTADGAARTDTAPSIKAPATAARTNPSTTAASAPPIAAVPATAPSVGVPRALDLNANLHLAAIESALAPDERMLVHTMISALSPDVRDQWLDVLLSVPPAEGAQVLREALHEAMAQAEPTASPEDTTTAAGGAAAPMTRAFAPTATSPAYKLAPGATSPAYKPAPTSTTPAYKSAPTPTSPAYKSAPTPTSDATTSSSAAPGTTSVTPGSTSRAALPLEAHQSATPAAVPVMPGADLPVLDANAATLFQSVGNALSFAEQMRAYELAAQLPPAEIRRWYADLVKLPVPEAVAKIRAALAAMDGRKGGVS